MNAISLAPGILYCDLTRDVIPHLHLEHFFSKHAKFQRSLEAS